MDEVRIIIAGGRDFRDFNHAEAEINSVLSTVIGDVTIISGGASGADEIGERYAKEHGLKLVTMPAEWDKYGRAAGPKRNAEMAHYASEAPKGILIAFWDGNSKGTKNMINTAGKYGLRINVMPY